MGTLKALFSIYNTLSVLTYPIVTCSQPNITRFARAFNPIHIARNPCRFLIEQFIERLIKLNHIVAIVS